MSNSPPEPPQSTLPFSTTAPPSGRPLEKQPPSQPPPKRLRTEIAQSIVPVQRDVIVSLSSWQPSQSNQPLLPNVRTSHQSTTSSPAQLFPVTTSATLLDNPQDGELSSAEPQPSTTSSLPKEVRRVWNRRVFEQSGVSKNLLKALETFTGKVPHIPTHLDPSRKKHVRNMRGWVLNLGLPLHNPTWESLIHVIRTDNSLHAISDHWDYDLCRHILGKIVHDKNSKQQEHPGNQPKRTRQAINNAIKRELTCPSESGSNSRGKTFRELFREQCKQADIELPDVEESAIPKKIPDASEKSTTIPESTSPSSPHEAETQQRTTTAAGEDSYVSLPFTQHMDRPSPSVVVDDTELSRLRSQCPETDEWNRTAWWQLPNNEDVKKLPLLLVDSHLYELHVLLTDFRWIARTFHCVDFRNGMRQAPTDGYDVMLKHAQKPGTKRSPADIESFRLIRNAMMLIIPILSTENPSNPTDSTFIAHLATQLVGRLLDLKRRFPVIASLIQSITEHAPRPWLRPLTRCFHQPRTDIKLAVPSNGIFTPHLIVLSEDGTILATSGTSVVPIKPDPSKLTTNTSQRSTNMKDSMSSQPALTRKRSSIIIWDVQSGKCVCEGPEIPNLVRHLALSRDNNCIIGETVDGLYFWHLDKSKEMWTISSLVEATPRIKSVSSITAAVGSSRVLTTHRLPQEPRIVLWDTKTGQKLDSFDRVTSNANCIDVSGCGDYFASGHDNGFIHLWTINEKVPILSFKNEGADRGQQQVVALADVNRARTTLYPTISISFYEKGEERWLTAVSANEIIRVWLLPPQTISHNQWQSFVSSRRTAVLKCPRVRDVKWSQNGNFFTGGDDGIARMWRRGSDAKWEWYAIDKENWERSLDLSTVLLSCGKRSQLVATYVTKSPYVTVWDMGTTGRNGLRRKRKWLYRPYLPLVPNSIDGMDIRHLPLVPNSIDGMDIRHLTTYEQRVGPDNNQGQGKDLKWSAHGNIRAIRRGLESFFGTLDTKSSTKPEGEMQPWLKMRPSGGVSGMEGPEQKPLRVCFEQPVTIGQSGEFKAGSEMADTSIGDMRDMGMVGVGSETKGGVRRRGMAAALQDGTIGVFELEGFDVLEEGGEMKEEEELKEIEGENGKGEEKLTSEKIGGETKKGVREGRKVGWDSMQIASSAESAEEGRMEVD